jgi:hypothetical protein
MRCSARLKLQSHAARRLVSRVSKIWDVKKNNEISDFCTIRGNASLKGLFLSQRRQERKEMLTSGSLCERLGEKP